MGGGVVRSGVGMLAVLRCQKIFALKFAKATIKKIERPNPPLNALIDFDADRVRAQAAALGHGGREPGILSGLPMSVKASISVAGHPGGARGSLEPGNIPGPASAVGLTVGEGGGAGCLRIH